MLTNFPLMALALIIYNGIMFGLGGAALTWQTEIFSLNMVSGATWVFDLGDLMLTIGLVLLFVIMLALQMNWLRKQPV